MNLEWDQREALQEKHRFSEKTCADSDVSGLEFFGSRYLQAGLKSNARVLLMRPCIPTNHSRKSRRFGGATNAKHPMHFMMRRANRARL